MKQLGQNHKLTYDALPKKKYRTIYIIMAFTSFNTFSSTNLNTIYPILVGLNGLGGTLTQSGGFNTNVFNSSGTFTLTKTTIVNYLIVAGGGGGGSYPNSNNRAGGGGGATAGQQRGQVQEQAFTLFKQVSLQVGLKINFTPPLAASHGFGLSPMTLSPSPLHPSRPSSSPPSET